MIYKLLRVAFRAWREKVAKRKVKRRTMQVGILINEANAIAKALNKKTSFQLKLWSSLPTAGGNNQLNKVQFPRQLIHLKRHRLV